jgi:hypothetical protein
VSKASSTAVTDDITSLLMLMVDEYMAAGNAGTCFATRTAFQSSSCFVIVVLDNSTHMHQKWCQYDG